MTGLNRWLAVAMCVAAAGCGSKSSDNPGPTAPGSTNPALTAPVPALPAEEVQLDTLRPTLTVTNGTSTQPGTRTYEFQISDRPDFAALTAPAATFLVIVAKTGVPEGSNGSTSFTPDTDLQPTTRFYWRARLAQGTTTSAWSATRSFNSKLVGYSRPGELYDPLIHSETIGTRIGSTTFIDGKGIRINDINSYVRYQLPQTIASGEFSVEVEGLRPNGPSGKYGVSSPGGSYNPAPHYAYLGANNVPLVRKTDRGLA